MNNPTEKELNREVVRWYIVRCHSRSCQRVRSLFEAKGVEYYIPEMLRVTTVKGKKVKKLVPVIKDIFFVHSSYNDLKKLIFVDCIPIIFYFSHTSHIQDDAIWVKDKEMEVFMRASRMLDRNPEVKCFGEIKFKKGDRIRVVDGALAGAEGYLTQIKRGQKKQLVITLANLITLNISVEEQDLIELIDN